MFVSRALKLNGKEHVENSVEKLHVPIVESFNTTENSLAGEAKSLATMFIDSNSDTFSVLK